MLGDAVRAPRRICQASTALLLHGMIGDLITSETHRVDSRAEQVCDRLVELVNQVSGAGSVFPSPFPVDTQLSDLGISSLKMVNLMLAVELEFDIAIPQSDITPENFQSVSSIQALVQKMLNMRRQ
jgi:acyl carrier protein